MVKYSSEIQNSLDLRNVTYYYIQKSSSVSNSFTLKPSSVYRIEPFDYSFDQPEQDSFVVTCLAISACNVKELRMQVRFQKVCYGKGARK